MAVETHTASCLLSDLMGNTSMLAPNPGTLLTRLADCALFAGLPKSILVSVLWHADVVDFAAGDTILQQGDASTCLWVLVEGLAAVTSCEAWSPGAKTLGWVKPGESVGETGVLTARPRTATVTAVTHARALCISASGFQELMSLHAQLGVQVSTLLAKRLAHSVLHQRMAQQRGRLIAVVSDAPAQAEVLVGAIAAKAGGAVETFNAARVDAQQQGAPEAVERMIATGQHLDRRVACVDVVVVTVPTDIDAAYARPLLERADIVLVAPDNDSRCLRRRLRELSGEFPAHIVRVEFAPASAQVVFDRLGRPHEVSAFVPTTSDVDQEIDPAPHLDRAKALFGECFGGATIREAEGVWKSEEFGLVGERVLMVTAACDQGLLNAHLDKVTAFLLDLKQLLRQEAVAMRVDGRLILL